MIEEVELTPFDFAEIEIEEKKVHRTNYSRIGVTPDEFRKLLAKARKHIPVWHIRPPHNSNPVLRYNGYITIGEDKVEMWYCLNKKNYNVVTYMDERPIYTLITGGEVWRRYKRFYHTPGDYYPENAKWNEDDDYRVCAKALLWFNEDLTGSRIDDCYGYDLNSAYTSILMGSWIDTDPKKIRYHSLVKENEIGMSYDMEEGMRLRFEGSRADFVFPLREPPAKLRKWMMEVFNNKQRTSGLLKNPNLTEDQRFELMKQKMEAKAILNYFVGILQLYDPFLRAFIVCMCNEKVRQYINKDTLVCNTDSIVSRTRREDIEQNLGSKIGQWKLEHHGQFAFRGLNYQWGYEVPTYRGVPKIAFGETFDILTMPPPTLDLKWYFDKDPNKFNLYRITEV